MSELVRARRAQNCVRRLRPPQSSRNPFNSSQPITMAHATALILCLLCAAGAATHARQLRQAGGTGAENSSGTMMSPAADQAPQQDGGNMAGGAALPGADGGFMQAQGMDASMGGGGAAANNSFPDWASAIQAANATGNVSILLAAVNETGVGAALNESTAWTIFAPTDEAFNATLAQLKMTPEALLAPEQRPLLLRILSYHVVPSGAVTSANLTNGQNLTTAIEGEAITAALNGTNVTLVGTTNNASVTTPDVMVNASVIHLIDAVLLPTGLNLTTNATTGVDTSGFGAAGGGAAGAANGAAAGGAGAAGADMMPGGGGAAGGDAMNATSPSAAGDGASGGGAGASSGQ